MKRCTPGGTRELTGLPCKELYELKKVVFGFSVNTHSIGNAFTSLKECGRSAEMQYSKHVSVKGGRISTAHSSIQCQCYRLIINT